MNCHPKDLMKAYLNTDSDLLGETEVVNYYLRLWPPLCRAQVKYLNSLIMSVQIS